MSRHLEGTPSRLRRREDYNATIPRQGMHRAASASRGLGRPRSAEQGFATRTSNGRGIPAADTGPTPITLTGSWGNTRPARKLSWSQAAPARRRPWRAGRSSTPLAEATRSQAGEGGGCVADRRPAHAGGRRRRHNRQQQLPAVAASFIAQPLATRHLSAKQIMFCIFLASECFSISSLV